LTVNNYLFRQYKTFDQYSFISYLRELKRKFHKLILFLDRAPPQHCRSKRVRAYLERNSDVMIVEYLPKGSPYLSAVEECWRQGKDDLFIGIKILSQVCKSKNSYYKLL
jgi:transposase